MGSAVALMATLVSGPAQALTVTYTATDLPDVVVGQDRWSIDYLLSSSFSAFAGINLLYPYAQYGDLAVTAAPNPTIWSADITQPDASGFGDGLIALSPFVDALASDLPFSVEFTWLGTGSPGSQDFEVFDSGFSNVGNGQTVPPGNSVPEPGTMLMVASALFLLSLNGLGRQKSGSQLFAVQNSL